MSENQSKVHYDALTGLRAIAAIMVFVYHNRKYWRDDLAWPIMRFISEWHIGVTIFFVLSGFLLAYRYQASPLESGKSYLKYILLRIARIFPMYWLLLTAYFLEPFYSKSVTTYFLQYSLLYPLYQQYALTGITQAWSLSVEFFFYIFSPFLFLLLKKKWQICIGFLIVLFLVSWGIGYGIKLYNGNSKGFLYPVSFILGNTFFGRSLEFFFGMLLAFVMKINPKLIPLSKLKKPTLYAGLLMLIATISIAYFARNNFVHGVERWEGRLIHETVLPISIALFLFGLMTEKTWVSQFLSSRLMLLLGNASFIFYLVHISYFNLKLKSYIYLPDRNFVLLWICSVIIYLLIEKPLYNLCRQWIAKI